MINQTKEGKCIGQIVFVTKINIQVPGETVPVIPTAGAPAGGNLLDDEGDAGKPLSIVLVILLPTLFLGRKLLSTCCVESSFCYLDIQLHYICMFIVYLCCRCSDVGSITCCSDAEIAGKPILIVVPEGLYSEVLMCV